MPRLFRLKTILAKIETVYGTDATPTGAADAILVRNVSINPQENDVVSRELVRAFLAGEDELPVATRVALDFEVEMAGAGAVDTPPKYGPLLRACGFAQTITATVKVEYKLVTSGFEACTIYFNMDGKLHKLLGARGNLSMKLNAKEVPAYMFKFTGLYVGISDAAFPATTLTAFQKPLPVNRVNTTGFTLHGFAGFMYGMDIDMANSLIHRNLVGVEDVLITGRKPAGNITIEDPTQAQKDYYATVQAATLGALAITHGTAVGGKVKIDAPQVQLRAPALEERDGIAALKMGMLLLPTAAGNDEITITTL